MINFLKGLFKPTPYLPMEEDDTSFTVFIFMFLVVAYIVLRLI